MTRLLMTALLFGLLLRSAPAAEVATRDVSGIRVPVTVEMQDPPLRLTLNGSGVRRKLFFRIYVAALYLPEHTSDASRILALRQPARLDMQFLYRFIRRGKLLASWDEGFRSNLSPQEYQALKPQIERFEALFGNARRGDHYSFTCVPGRGVRVRLGRKPPVWIEGDAFARALLAIWLGKHPADAELKLALLGGSPSASP